MPDTGPQEVRFIMKWVIHMQIVMFIYRNMCPQQLHVYRKLVWALDLNGIADMYESYEAANLWSFITGTPEGLRVSFVKAEHSTFRWAGPEQAVISSHGHAVHTLHKSGHWVHADNPDGMFGCFFVHSSLAFGSVCSSYLIPQHSVVGAACQAGDTHCFV